MRLSFIHFILFSLGLTGFFSSCNRSSGSTWEDTKTLGRYIQRGSKLLFKQNPDSKMVHNDYEFKGPLEEDFIPLNQSEIYSVSAHATEEPVIAKTLEEVPSASEFQIPSIDAFKKPSSELAQIFKTVHFDTDEFVLKRSEDLVAIDNIVSYMKKHPNLYLFVLGHCDERASEAYNLSLGTKRASHVRNLLVKRGVNPHHIFTISFGKEIPLDPGHTKESWMKNRRAEFKIYEKQPGMMNNH